MLKWWFAWRRFKRQIQVIWSEYTGKPLPPSSVEGIQERNRREHG